MTSTLTLILPQFIIRPAAVPLLQVLFHAPVLWGHFESADVVSVSLKHRLLEVGEDCCGSGSAQLGSACSALHIRSNWRCNPQVPDSEQRKRRGIVLFMTGLNIVKPPHPLFFILFYLFFIFLFCFRQQQRGNLRKKSLCVWATMRTLRSDAAEFCY